VTQNDGHEFVVGSGGCIGVEDVCRWNGGPRKHRHAGGKATGAAGTGAGSVFCEAGGDRMSGCFKVGFRRVVRAFD
jgi:hypothetical protein